MPYNAHPRGGVSRPFDKRFSYPPEVCQHFAAMPTSSHSLALAAPLSLCRSGFEGAGGGEVKVHALDGVSSVKRNATGSQQGGSR